MRTLAKELVNILMVILVLPLLLLYFLGSIFLDKDSLVAGFSQLLSLIPGKAGNYYRTSFYRFVLTQCHKETVISFATLFSQVDTEIEVGVYIGPQCNIGKSKIERNCLLGSGVHIMSGKKQHKFRDPKTPIKDQGGIYEKVTIGEDTWIGNGALIMADIGKKCVIGAGSVVTEEVEDYSVVGGNPATLIKKRTF